MTKTFLTLLISCFFLASCNQKAVSTKKIICVGASITCGATTANPETDSYPSQLKALLGKGYEVENYGVSGTTMLRKGNHPYWNTEAYQQALKSNPDIVFIDLGGNDSKAINRIYMNEFETDCREMIRSFASLPSNPRIILLTPIVSFETDSNSIWDATIVQEITPATWRAAGREGVEVIEMHGILNSHPELMPDNIHPDAKGSGMMAQEMHQYLMANPTYSSVVLPENPFIKHMYTADPSAHVWQDGRLYVYASQDHSPAQGCDLMDNYHVFSTEDMVTWTDHGEIFSSVDVPWGRKEGGFMWAPDCAYRNGTYYYYFPHPSETDWNTSWKIGVATSSKPAEDFTVQGYIQGIDPLIDPCIFLDDDGTAYFYQGGGSICKGGKLKDNMVEIEGEMIVMEGLEDFHEGTWVHKRNGIYYLSYADNHDDGEKFNRMRYAMSDSPLGPWTYKGIYIDPTDSYTNHGSIVEYKGQWYAFYHNSNLSEGHHWERSICVDKLYYNLDGTIRKVFQTKN